MCNFAESINEILDDHHIFLLKGIELTPKHSFPVLHHIKQFELPRRIIPFSLGIGSSWSDYDCWICFYEWDDKFVRLWNNPLNYLEKLKKFRGVISPDFSLSIFADEEDQFTPIYKGRLLAAWLEQNGVPVIANIRYANKYSQVFSCEGVPISSTIAIGTNGFLTKKKFREPLIEGIDFAVKTTLPKTILVYGGCPNRIFGKYIKQGIQIIPFKSQTTQTLDNRKKQKRQKQLVEIKQGELF